MASLLQIASAVGLPGGLSDRHIFDVGLPDDPRFSNGTALRRTTGKPKRPYGSIEHTAVGGIVVLRCRYGHFDGANGRRSLLQAIR